MYLHNLNGTQQVYFPLLELKGVTECIENCKLVVNLCNRITFNTSNPTITLRV